MNPNSTTIESHARVEARMCSAKASVELVGRRITRSSSGNGSGYQPGEGLIGSIVAPAYAQNRVKRHAPSPSTSPADLSVPERDPRCRLNSHDIRLSAGRWQVVWLWNHAAAPGFWLTG